MSKTGKMNAAVCHGKRDIRIETRPIPTPVPGEALIRIKAVGICGSDLHFFEDGVCGTCPISRPFIIGHECSGIVEETGPGVKQVRPGDRVVIEPGKTCGRCFHCRRGEYNLCPDVDFLGSCPSEGAMCEFLVMPENMLFPLPAALRMEDGILAEPLAVGVHAAVQAGVGLGKTVAVSGCGTIGLMTIAACRAAGAADILALDLIPSRLELARAFGATLGMDAAAYSEDTVRQATDGLGFDVVMEASGHPVSMARAVAMCRRGGVVIAIGVPSGATVPMPMSAVVDRAISLRGIFRYANNFAAAVNLLAQGKVPVRGFVSRTFPLASAPEAFAYAGANKRDALKVAVLS